jgi:hypothetical protein
VNRECLLSCSQEHIIIISLAHIMAASTSETSVNFNQRTLLSILKDIFTLAPVRTWNLTRQRLVLSNNSEPWLATCRSSFSFSVGACVCVCWYADVQLHSRNPIAVQSHSISFIPSPHRFFRLWVGSEGGQQITIYWAGPNRVERSECKPQKSILTLIGCLDTVQHRNAAAHI